MSNVIVIGAGAAGMMAAIAAAQNGNQVTVLEKTNNVEAAAVVGKVVAKKALEKGIATVVYDRGGFIYEGKVKALAEAAREAGLEF